MTNNIRIAILAAAATLVAPVFAQSPTDTAAQDKKFVYMAEQGSMDEIAAAKIALKKSKNDDVRQFAQKMIDDHTKLIADMKPFADQMMVKPVTMMSPTDKAESQRLASMSGSKFDMEYVKAMVADHHKDLADFKTEADTTTNPDLKATVTNGEMVIKEHTDMIDSIAQKMNIPTPPAAGL